MHEKERLARISSSENIVESPAENEGFPDYADLDGCKDVGQASESMHGGAIIG